MRDQEINQPPAASSFGFTLRDVLAIGFRHKRAFLLCFVGILLGTVAAILLLPATYESTAQIVVKRERVHAARRIHPVHRGVCRNGGRAPGAGHGGKRLQ